VGTLALPQTPRNRRPTSKERGRKGTGGRGEERRGGEGMEGN